MKKCDIIIPIYNAYDCVIKCLDSIIENTNMTNYRIICINDKSSDERMQDLLNKYKEKYSFVVVLENEKNLGFVGTVNKGMKYSTNDVILLNSDTEVSKNWLDKIIQCAYSEKKIATVTPLSNNATLVSVPVGLQRNELPSNISFANYAKIVEKCSYHDNNELPTAHGFCMFIKREVIELVGYFDDVTFEKGYGEENDFSFRCLDYGYKNVLCDSVIIYHKEKQSFSSQREELVKKHGEILNNKYPVYTKRIELWCGNFPINYICKNIRYALGLYKRKNILIIIHDWKDVMNNVGGTTLHVRDLIFNLRKKYNFHVLTPENGIYKVYSYFENSEETLDLNYRIEYFNLIPKYNHNYKIMLENVIDALGIDYIHVHHLLNHFFDIADVINDKKIKSSITLHDFYAICPSINMLYKMEKFCENVENKNCAECLKYKSGLQNDVIGEWQKDLSEFLKAFTNVIVPSKDTKERFLRTYPELNIKVIEHGIDIKKSNKIKSIKGKDHFNVAFVGVMAIHKGAYILRDLVNKNKKENITYHLFGYSEIEELRKNKKNYVYHDRYNREELPDLLEQNDIDLICSFSIWPETYSYTLTEEIASKIPVLAYDIGAVGERINLNHIGWVIPLETNFKDIIKKIEDIFKNSKEYDEVIKNIEKYKIKTCKEMAKEYEKIYELNVKEANYTVLGKLVKQSFGTVQTTNAAEYNLIVNSLRWKLISKIKVPQTIKNIIKKAMR